MRDDTVGLAILGFTGLCLLALLVLLAIGFRKRWYLLQHINDPSGEWVPQKLWALSGCAPLCFMFYRAAGPYASEQAAKADAQKAAEKRGGAKPAPADN